MLRTHKNYLFLFLFLANSLQASEFSDDKNLKDTANKIVNELNESFENIYNPIFSSKLFRVKIC